MAIIQPGAAAQEDALVTATEPYLENLALVRKDPEGCREAIWQCGAIIGWPDLHVGPVRLTGGPDGWRAILNDCIPLWLLTIWEGMDESIRRWLEQTERHALRSEPFTHLDFGPGRECEDCGGELQRYRVYRCDACVERDYERRERLEPDRLKPKLHTAERKPTQLMQPAIVPKQKKRPVRYSKTA